MHGWQALLPAARPPAVLHRASSIPALLPAALCRSLPVQGHLFTMAVQTGHSLQPASRSLAVWVGGCRHHPALSVQDVGYWMCISHASVLTHQACLCPFSGAGPNDTCAWQDDGQHWPDSLHCRKKAIFNETDDIWKDASALSHLSSSSQSKDWNREFLLWKETLVLTQILLPALSPCSLCRAHTQVSAVLALLASTLLLQQMHSFCFMLMSF